ncbi:ABC transporter permease [Bacillota bacterium Meth-B3]
MKRLRRLLSTSVSASLLAIVAGLAAGFLILLFSNPSSAFQGLLIILKGGWNTGVKGLGQVLYYATPIIMTGLSVGFAFKTGLFNIGAPGQLVVGGFVATYVGALWPMPAGLHWAFALLCGMVAGGLWGLVPGLFKAYLNVNEVISSIMMNYIGLYGTRYLIKLTPLFDSLRNQTVNVLDTAVIPKGGLDRLFYNMKGNYVDVSSVNAGLYIAIGLAIVMYIILNRTTFGYELKACGLNRNASRYAGIDENRSIVLSMVIAGALAGTAGALMYLAPASGMHIHVDEIMPSQGFNGIPVALLGLSNPIGIIFAGLFVAHITVGGSQLQSLKYMQEVIDIIIALVIYFSAFSLAVRGLLARAKRVPASAAEKMEGVR